MCLFSVNRSPTPSLAPPPVSDEGKAVELSKIILVEKLSFLSSLSELFFELGPSSLQPQEYQRFSSISLTYKK